MHFAMLAFLPWLVLVVPLCVLWPRDAVVRVTGVAIFAMSTAWLLLDGLLYVERQFHINRLTMQVLGWHTWLFGLFYLLMFTLAASLISKRLWTFTARPATANRGKWIGILFCGCYVVSQTMHAWADANYYVPVTRMGYALPQYHPVTAKRFFNKHGWVDMQKNRERQFMARGDTMTGDLRYPQSPLQCQPDKPLNLLVILIDAMRADMLDPKITPHLSRFADTAAQFSRHFSGGNSSRMGVFSLFYGLPAQYWKVIEGGQQPPVIIEQLQRYGYQFGIFGSGPLYRPVSLDRTAFASLAGIRVKTPSKTGRAWERDQVITQDWQQWLSQRVPDTPFFGFLFYDGPTSKSYPPDYETYVAAAEHQGVSNELARYQTAIRHDDVLIQEVLDDLEQRRLLDSTVVMFTSDHGQEFNDSGQGFTGHGSAYNPYQLHVPFLLRWPGESPTVYTHRTSHNDWVVTVLEKLLGCKNPPSDYTSNGTNLFAQESWPWLIVGSYHNFAVVSPSHIIISHLNGMLEVRDSAYRLIDSPQLDTEMITQVLHETSRFYRKK
jgi:membrane-anchored protein YejM (alkaline phosphatase superfamily)